MVNWLVSESILPPMSNNQKSWTSTGNVRVKAEKVFKARGLKGTRSQREGSPVRRVQCFALLFTTLRFFLLQKYWLKD